jgi:hypothetical protein
LLLLLLLRCCKILLDLPRLILPYATSHLLLPLLLQVRLLLRFDPL